jgi:hypothetical protein
VLTDFLLNSMEKNKSGDVSMVREHDDDWLNGTVISKQMYVRFFFFFFAISCLLCFISCQM